jgi:hypothetical protein
VTPISINSLSNFGVPGLNGDRSAVLQPILSNRFRITFYNFGDPGEVAPYDLTRACRKVGRPRYTFEEQKLYSYVSTVYIASRVEFETVEVTWFDDIDNSVQRRVQQQLSKQQNFFDQTASRAGQNYKFEMDVDVLAGGAGTGSSTDPNVLQRWSFVGCFITSANMNDLSYQESGPVEISCTVRFDNAICFDQDGLQLGTFDHAPEIEGQVGLFSTGIGGIF